MEISWFISYYHVETGGRVFGTLSVFWVFFCGTRDWTRGLTLPRQARYHFSTTWATLQALFYVEYFWDMISCTFCPGWPQTAILLMSVCWVAKITESPVSSCLCIFVTTPKIIIIYRIPIYIHTVDVKYNSAVKGNMQQLLTMQQPGKSHIDTSE
jgi:hypothetical protein